MNNQTFAFELEAIHNADVRDQVSALLDVAPAYFWHVAASSSGKYHPAYALGEGGLVRHVKAAVRFGIELATIKGFSELEVDYALAALILHDICKQGRSDEGDHTVFEHPLLAAQFIKENAAPWFSSIVCPLVASHMGQWNTSKYSTAQLPVPVTPLEQFVHECDYLASRKCFDVEFAESVAKVKSGTDSPSMELKNITVFNFSHVIKTFSSIDEALNFAVSDSRKACFAGKDREASRRVACTVGTKGFGFSMRNFAHYNDESLDEQAAWFEIAITKDGRIIRDDEGGIDTAMFQIRYNVLKSFFKSLENAPKVTLKSVWVSLAMLDQGGVWTKEEAMARYARLYHNFA